MDEVTKAIQGDHVPKCMMLADNIVLTGENLEEVNNRLDEWRLALEGMELRICRNKTEYTEYDFGGKDQEVYGTRRAMTISGDVIDEVKSFKYLGSLIQKDRGFGMAVKHRIKCG